MTKPLRKTMPWVTERIDECRAAFGADQIDPQIRAGMQGNNMAFYARENGQEVGTKPPDLSAISVKLSETIIGPMAAPKKERN